MSNLNNKTPKVAVLDNRGLTVREVAYHRHPDSPDTTDERITYHQYDTRGTLTQSADTRLHDAGLASFSYLTDLTGGILRTTGVDNGTTVALNDVAGRPVMAVSNIHTADDGTQDLSQAVTRTWQYEDATLPGRPLSLTEQTTGGAARITERFVYAGNTDAEKALNLAGVCVSHYDTAGRVQTDSMALTGVPFSVTHHLLKDADSPDTVADWQGGDASAWNDLLDSEAHTTLTTADATGTVLTTTDAKGNMQRVAYNVAGLLSGSWLTLKGGTEQVIVKSLTYSAAGQKLREEHGNGVVTTYLYEPETQRLTGVKTERPAGHASGAKVLQDLRYEYDPVGNVLKITNDAEETRFWRNQKVVPENTYVYDSLYQLVSATGREMANIAQQGTNLPSATVPLPTDSSAYTNYTRTYSYDNAGNLTQIRHSAPATNNSYTTGITVSDKSNRGVLSTLTTKPSEVEALFTAGGQQTQLQPGQPLVWTPRNELLKVSPVQRDGSTDDSESYRYDGSSQRILKVSTQKTGNSMLTQRALYLPGLELRTTSTGETETESLQVICVGEAGRAQVRMLHWESGQPAAVTGDQLRYSYDSLTGSSGLELDSDGNIISQEEYYPYGGTAVWTARSTVEANYKTVRYSGKERDATGLYYYGYRYYQPWAGRWLSADPAGAVDGLNLFRMVRNNPVTLMDSDGLVPQGLQARGETPPSRSHRAGYIYLPFISPDMIHMSVGINLRRHTLGKSLYPVITHGELALEPIMEEAKRQLAEAGEYINTAAEISAEPRLAARHDMVAAIAMDFSRKLAVLKKTTYLSNINDGNSRLSTLVAGKDKLYVLGHGSPGEDGISGDQEGKTSLTSKQIVDMLTSDGLPNDFDDIRFNACFGADTKDISSFNPALLDESAGLPPKNWFAKKFYAVPMAEKVSRQLSDRGYAGIVSAYHGAGDVYSLREMHTRTIKIKNNEEIKTRASLVRRTFKPG